MCKIAEHRIANRDRPGTRRGGKAHYSIRRSDLRALCVMRGLWLLEHLLACARRRRLGDRADDPTADVAECPPDGLLITLDEQHIWLLLDDVDAGVLQPTGNLAVCLGVVRYAVHHNPLAHGPSNPRPPYQASGSRGVPRLVQHHPGRYSGSPKPS